jgi:hypothetical protein
MKGNIMRSLNDAEVKLISGGLVATPALSPYLGTVLRPIRVPVHAVLPVVPPSVV